MAWERIFLKPCFLNGAMKQKITINYHVMLNRRRRGEFFKIYKKLPKKSILRL